MADKNLPRWPVHWIKPLMAESYSTKTIDRRVITEMEIGSISRVEFNTDEGEVSGGVLLDPLQANWLESFDRDVLKHGSGWFYMPLWTGGRYLEHKVKFKERPQLTAKVGAEYSQYAFTLEVEKREGLMGGDAALLLTRFTQENILELHELLSFALKEIGPGCTNLPRNIWTAATAEWEKI